MKKEYDLRPLIEKLELAQPDEKDTICLVMRLSAQHGSTGRPDEVLLELGFDPHSSHLERTSLIMED